MHFIPFTAPCLGLFMGLLKPKAGATRLVNITGLHHTEEVEHTPALLPELKELYYQFEHLRS